MKKSRGFKWKYSTKIAKIEGAVDKNAVNIIYHSPFGWKNEFCKKKRILIFCKFEGKNGGERGDFAVVGVCVFCEGFP